MSLELALVIGLAATAVVVLLWRLLAGSDQKKSGAKGAPPRGAARTAKAGSRASDREEASGLRPRPRNVSPTLVVKPLDPNDLAAFGDDEDEDEITVVRVDVEPTGQHSAPNAVAELYVVDTDAEIDEPTLKHLALITSAGAQSDVGRKRRRNDDRFLSLDSHHVYAVADGMGGYAGGDIAAQIAVDSLARSFREQAFESTITSEHELPERATQLVRAVQDANVAIYERGKRDPWLSQMGTTLVAARFAPRKERVYIAHVGDSRCYRLRGGELTQLTSDHTLGAETALAEDDPTAGCLSRAVGVARSLTIDVIVAKPQLDDIYLLCSDGLTRMLDEDESLCEILQGHQTPQDAARALVEEANARGGKDNVTAIVVRVDPPTSISEFPPDIGAASA